MKYMKEAAEFMKSIKKTDELVIVFNNDGDGICSCSIFIKFLEKMGMRKPYIISQPMPMDKNLVSRIKTTVPNKIIFLDLVVDQQEDVVKKMRGFADIFVIDHHKITKNMNDKNVVYYNPRLTRSDIYQSTSYCAYKVVSEITDMSEALWMSAVGMVSDYNLDDSKDLVDLSKKKFDTKDLYGSNLGRIADMISAARATNVLSCEEMVELFIKMDDPGKIEDMEKGRKLVDSYNTIQKEMFSIMEDIKANAEKSGNVIMYNLKSQYNLSSPVSTRASEMYMDKLFLIYNKVGTKYKISARNQSKNIDAGRVMALACKGLKASGGGHEAAAGATIDERDWEKFKENVMRIVNGE